jgi:hypothetical protein
MRATEPVWTLWTWRNLTLSSNRTPSVKPRSLSLYRQKCSSSPIMLEMINVLKKAVSQTLHLWTSIESETTENYVEAFPVGLHCLCLPYSEPPVVNPTSTSLRSIAVAYVLLSECLIMTSCLLMKGFPWQDVIHFATAVTLQWRHNEVPFSHESQTQ